jgi:hypothetical protein
MYESLNDNLLKQGDVLDGIIFCYLAGEPVGIADMQTGRIVKEVTFDELPTAIDPKDPNTAVIAKPLVGWGMVISQTCDIQRDNHHICVARVRSIDSTLQGFSAKSRVNQIKDILSIVNNKQFGFFYLKESEENALPKSVANLTEIHAFHPGVKDWLVRRRKLRLGAEALKALQFQLGHFFGRLAINERYALSDEEAGLVGR